MTELAALPNLGLWGDGDEVSAIEDAFDAIGVDLPVKDAPAWVTVGDLWESVRRVAPVTAAQLSSWDKFRQALSEETGVEWTRISLETAILDGKGHSVMSRIFFSVRQWWANRGA